MLADKLFVLVDKSHAQVIYNIKNLTKATVQLQYTSGGKYTVSCNDTEKKSPLLDFDINTNEKHFPIDPKRSSANTVMKWNLLRMFAGLACLACLEYLILVMLI